MSATKFGGKADSLERENAELRALLAAAEQELAELRAERTERRRPSLDEMTLADMEALASRVSVAVALLREARPFMGGPEAPRPASDATSSPEVPRPPPQPIDHPRAKVRLSPEEEGRKKALLRANRGEETPA